MKEPVLSYSERHVVARRLRAYRKKLFMTQAVVAHLSGMDETVIKNIEAAKPASAVSYRSVAQTIGLTPEQLVDVREVDIFATMTAEIQDLIDNLIETDFTAPSETGTFAAQFSPTDPDSFNALYNVGLKIGSDKFTLFDVLVRYKGHLDMEFASYLKEMGLETEQRLYIHSFSVLYYVFSALQPWERTNMQFALDKMMEQVREFIDWQEAHASPYHNRIDPVTGELRGPPKFHGRD